MMIPDLRGELNIVIRFWTRPAASSDPKIDDSQVKYRTTEIINQGQLPWEELSQPNSPETLLSDNNIFSRTTVSF